MDSLSSAVASYIVAAVGILITCSIDRKKIEDRSQIYSEFFFMSVLLPLVTYIVFALDKCAR